MAGESPVAPAPAASVVLVRAAAPGAAEPLEVYLIRRQPRLRFLGGFYAFPGGRVDPADAAPAALARCRGLDAGQAAALLAGASPPALAYWVAAARELLEECGVLLAVDAAGRPLSGAPAVVARVDRLRRELMAGGASFGELLAREGWYVDCAALRYLSHFTTPRASPIRFSARFFLCRAPATQPPRLYPEEAAEARWIGPAEGYRRFRAGELPMAEPAEYALGYLAQFESLDSLWAAHADGRHKFDGLVDRIDGFWEGFDWAANRWRPRGAIC